MLSIWRVAAALAVLAVTATSAPASAHERLTADGSMASAAAAASPSSIESSPAPCSDSKYNLQGVKQKSTLQWAYKSASTPSYLTTSSVVTVLKRSFNNITGERNDCGRSDHVSATSSYLGTTSRGVGVTSSGTCGSSDGHNTVGFGALPSGYLALTCIRSVGTSIVEIDIKLTTGVHWALSLTGCSNAFMLESVATHEIGHAYGMDHVGETNHGRLTMSTYIDGPCENQEATLGLGDDNGLEAMY